MKLNEIPVKFVQSDRNVLFLEQSTLQLPQIKSVESGISQIWTWKSNLFLIHA